MQRDTRSTPRVALISPHPDDIALSMGGLLSRLDVDASLVLVTCFTASCTQCAADAADTTLTRAAEDAAYAGSIGAELVRLGFADSGVRSDRGRVTVPADEETELYRALCASLSAALRQAEIDVAFAPLAVGEHADHVHCRGAVLAHCEPSAIAWFEDQPYAQFEGGPATVERMVRRGIPELAADVVTLSAENLQAKLRGLDFYPSQVHPLWRQAVEDYAVTLGGGTRSAERVWWLPRDRRQITANVRADHLHSLRRQWISEAHP